MTIFRSPEWDPGLLTSACFPPCDAALVQTQLSRDAVRNNETNWQEVELNDICFLQGTNLNCTFFSAGSSRGSNSGVFAGLWSSTSSWPLDKSLGSDLASRSRLNWPGLSGPQPNTRTSRRGFG